MAYNFMICWLGGQLNKFLKCEMCACVVCFLACKWCFSDTAGDNIWEQCSGGPIVVLTDVGRGLELVQRFRSNSPFFGGKLINWVFSPWVNWKGLSLLPTKSRILLRQYHDFGEKVEKIFTEKQFEANIIMVVNDEKLTYHKDGLSQT